MSTSEINYPWLFSPDNLKYSTEYDVDNSQSRKRVLVFECSREKIAYFVLEQYFEDASRISRVIASFNTFNDAKSFAYQRARTRMCSSQNIGPHESQSLDLYPGQMFIER
ncbi:MAG: hypothetical protein ACK5VW_06530 [Holosporales bacterium]